MEKLLDVSQVCEITKLKKTTIYSLISKGLIPVIKLSGRCVRFRSSDIESWIESKSYDALPALASKTTPPWALRTKYKNRLSDDEVQRLVNSAKREVGI